MNHRFTFKNVHVCLAALTWIYISFPILCYKWIKTFKNGPNKICGRQPLKNRSDMVCLSTSNLLKAVFHKFYLVHSWIPWPKCLFTSLLPKLTWEELWDVPGFLYIIYLSLYVDYVKHCYSVLVKLHSESLQRCIFKPFKRLWWSLFGEIVNSNYFPKK